MHHGTNVGLITFSCPHLCLTVKPDQFCVTWLYIIACAWTCLCVLMHCCMHSNVIYLYSKKHEITTTTTFSCGCCLDLNNLFILLLSRIECLVELITMWCVYIRLFVLWGLAHLDKSSFRSGFGFGLWLGSSLFTFPGVEVRRIS